MKQPGSLGGRNDITLASDLPELGRWQVADVGYLEADELGAPDQFPTHGHFLLVELLDDDREEHYVQVTEGLDEMLVSWMEKEEVGFTEMTVEVDEATKAGDEETSSWRYVADMVPASELGPPSDGSD